LNHVLLAIMASAILAGSLAHAHPRKRVSSKRRQPAPVTYQSSYAKNGPMISARAVRRAVVQGMRDYLREPKFGGPTTRGTWNRIDLRSLSLQDVTIEAGRRDRFGYRLKLGEFPFTAHIKARQGKPGEKKTITMQVKSVIELREIRPRLSYGGRVKTTPHLKAEDAAHLGDTSTAYWID
jgi:hypothetical protein